MRNFIASKSVLLLNFIPFLCIIYKEGYIT